VPNDATDGNIEAPAAIIGVWRTFAASKKALAIAVITGCLAGGSSAGQLALVTRAIDEKGANATAALAFFALCGISLAASVISHLLLARLTQDNLFHMRLWISRCVLAAPLKRVQALGPHRLMAALTSDVESIVGAQETTPSLLIEGSKVTAAFAYLYTLSPPLLLGVLIFVFVCLFAVQGPLGWAWRVMKQARDAENTLFNHFRAATEGGKELKMDARRRRAFLDEDFTNTAHLLKMLRLKSILGLVLVDRWVETLFFLLLGVVVFLAPLRLAIEPETMTGFVLAILFLGGPLTLVGGWLPAISKGIVAFRNLEEMGLSLTAQAARPGPTPAAFDRKSPEALELVAVAHAYPGENGESGYALGPISLRIEPGELVFITGGNGSGKTTLALVLLGLLAPESGEIRLDGVAVTAANRDAYRQNFAAVFADAYVFDSLLGYTGAEAQARANEMLALLRLDHKLSINEGRFSTTELSRGQRKRIALLTAYVEDRPFYLFDEWAAEQDPQFRELFYRHLLPDLKKQGKTVLVITHDDRYFKCADRLLRMNLGKLEECETSYAHA
jgi:putative pyoverdin transport system ATP-binding/permease protein